MRDLWQEIAGMANLVLIGVRATLHTDHSLGGDYPLVPDSPHSTFLAKFTLILEADQYLCHTGLSGHYVLDERPC